MKYLIVVALNFAMLCGINAQNIEKVVSAFKSANTALMASEWAEEVELSIGDEVKYYSKTQAATKLQEWLKKAQPDSFSAKHSGGKGGNNVQYYVGQLSSAKGTYRVMIYYKQAGSTFKIDEIRISKG